jgi:putative transposase
MYQNEPLSPGQYYHIYNCGINGTPLFRIDHDYEHFLLLYERFIDPVAETYAWCLMGNHFHMLVQIKENVVYKYSRFVGIDEPDSVDKPDSVVRPVRLTEDFELIKWETIELRKHNLSCPSDDVENDNLSCPSDDIENDNLSCPSDDVENDNLSCPSDDDRLYKIPKPHLHFSHLFNAYSKYFNKKYRRHGSLFERPFKRKLVDNVEYLKQMVLYIHNNPVHHGFCSHPVEYPWTSYLTMISLKPVKLKRDVVIGWFDGEANFKHIHNGKVVTEEIEKLLRIG